MAKTLKISDFPYQKGDKAWVMLDGITPARREITGISPTQNGVKFKGIHYWSRNSCTHLSRVGKTKAEVLSKAIIKESTHLEYSMGRLLKEVQRKNNDWKKLSKLRTKLSQCYK